MSCQVEDVKPICCARSVSGVHLRSLCLRGVDQSFRPSIELVFIHLLLFAIVAADTFWLGRGRTQTWGLYSFILTLSIWLFLQRLLCLESVMIQFQYQSNANDAVIYLIYSNSAYMACWRQAQHQNEKVKPFRCSNNTWSTQICFDLSCCITMSDMISGWALK